VKGSFTGQAARAGARNYRFIQLSVECNLSPSGNARASSSANKRRLLLRAGRNAAAADECQAPYGHLEISQISRSRRCREITILRAPPPRTSFLFLLEVRVLPYAARGRILGFPDECRVPGIFTMLPRSRCEAILVARTAAENKNRLRILSLSHFPRI
jgi:hypothetical protein